MPRKGVKLKLGKGAKFALGTGGIGLTTYVLLGIMMPFLENFTASLSAGILSVFGTASSLGSLVLYNTLIVKVIPLCVGDIEIAVLTGAILSTADRKMDDRIFGAAAAFVFVMLINALRIATTMVAWDMYGLGAIEFIHSFLFRITLVGAIVGFYAVWYLREGVLEKLNKLLKEK